MQFQVSGVGAGSGLPVIGRAACSAAEGLNEGGAIFVFEYSSPALIMGPRSLRPDSWPVQHYNAILLLGDMHERPLWFVEL